MIKIVYACNNGWFDGLYLSILSILRRTKDPIEFYLLTADCSELNPNYTKLTKSNEKIIQDIVNEYNDKSSFTVIDCSDLYTKYLSKSINVNTKFSPYDIFRLFIDKYPCFDDKVLYLDIDTMALGNINEFFKIDLGDNEFAVCHNYYGRWHLKKDYFNAGVILFNMQIIRKNDFLSKARDIVINVKHKWPDQNALYLASNKYMFFPGNEFRYNWQKIKIGKDVIIKHFSANARFYLKTHLFYSNVKQWQIDEVHHHYHIYDFDEDYAIYKKMKETYKVSN